MLEFRKELEAAGISAEVRTVALNTAAGGGFDYIEAIGGLAAIIAAVQSYLKHRRGRISAEIEGKKIEAEGMDTEDTKELMRYAVVQLRKLDRKDGE